ncbi:MAG: hypothetical protein AAFR29_07590, partial [Pseudomonadota bacterium]
LFVQSSSCVPLVGGRVMNIPIRGIQIALLIAFFADLLGSAIQLFDILEQSKGLEYDQTMKRSIIVNIVKDAAYSAYYLADLAVIEILYRIWIERRSNAE